MTMGPTTGAGNFLHNLSQIHCIFIKAYFFYVKLLFSFLKK